MQDKITSILRTVVPAAWGAFITWLLSLWTPPGWLDPLINSLESEGAQVMITAIVIGAWYAAFRWLEPKLPDWLTRIVLGSSRTPTYSPPSS